MITKVDTCHLARMQACISLHRILKIPIYNSYHQLYLDSKSPNTRDTKNSSYMVIVILSVHSYNVSTKPSYVHRHYSPTNVMII